MALVLNMISFVITKRKYTCCDVWTKFQVRTTSVHSQSKLRAGQHDSRQLNQRWNKSSYRTLQLFATAPPSRHHNPPSQQQLCPSLFKQRTFSRSRQEHGKSNVGRQKMLQLASRLLSNVHGCVFWCSSQWCPKKKNRRNDSRSLVGLPIFKHTPVGVENLLQTRTSMWSPLTQKTIWWWWPDKLAQGLKASFKIKDYIIKEE